MSDIDPPYELPEDEYHNRVRVLADRLTDLQIRDTRAVRAAAERIVEHPNGTTHTVDSAAQLLTVAVDPRAVRPNQIRSQRVRGGRILQLLRATVWTPLLLVDATNGRFVVGQTYLSDPEVTPGTSSKVALAAPDSYGSVPSLVYRGTRQAIATALDENADYVRQVNSWEADIRVNGILMPLLAGHVEYRFTDAPPRPAVGVVDGTSRTASAHRILGLAESDIVAATPESLRKWLVRFVKTLAQDVKALASAVGPDPEGLLAAESAVNALTAEADLIVGWGWDEHVAGRPANVDPTYASTLNLALGAQNIEPKSFSAEAQGTLLAERSVNTLADYGLISSTELVYALGREDVTKVADDLGFSRHRDERCAWLIRLMTSPEPRLRRVLNEALGAKAFSARNRSRPTIELALRSFSGHDHQYLDRARNAAVHALWTDVGSAPWKVSPRPDAPALDELEAEALTEVRNGQPSAHCHEVAARGVVPLLALGGLGVDRGSARFRGQPAVVIGRMMKNEWGIRQLMATVRASREGRPFPRLDPEGRELPEDARLNTPSYNNDWLRERVLSEDVTTPVTQAEEPEKLLFQSLQSAWDAFERFRELKDPPYDSLNDDKWRDAAKTASRLSKNINKYVREED
ncbi:hypothetical protein E0500_014475 [Streptomyces sp. KM273126]|uniref:hypothetical protein n=1 Tax=Streptomyces sp. KM273126 TaxID=2545247 RepID=UPI0015EB788C|nr:hypothetical protein [Streptomyces sp. KM273126]MBA2808570.1 hypothetical protein [Streptomyces sp. KM273126]